MKTLQRIGTLAAVALTITTLGSARAGSAQPRGPAEPQASTRRGQVNQLTKELQSIRGRLETAAGAEASFLRDRGEVILEQRREAMLGLIDEDPAAALSSALDAESVAGLRAAFPSGAQHLESVGSYKGEAEVLFADDFLGGGSLKIIRMRLGSDWVYVQFAGPEPPGLVCRAVLEVEGMLVGDRLVAWGARVLDTDQLVGSCSPIGEQKVAVLIVDLPDDPDVRFPDPIGPDLKPVLEDIYFGSHTSGLSLDGFWREASYGAASASGQVFGPRPIPGDYTCDYPFGSYRFQMMTAAIAAFDAEVDFRVYTKVHVVYPHVGGLCAPGVGDVGCVNLDSTGDGAFTAGRAWLLADLIRDQGRNFGVLAASHEGGHNLGLQHAWALKYGSEVLGLPGTFASPLYEYADPYSAMGNFTPPGHYAAPQKALLGWLTPANVQTVTASGTYTLAPYEPSPLAGIRALKVKRGNDPTWIWLEARRSGSVYDCPPGGLASCSGVIGNYDYPLDPTPGDIDSSPCPNCSFLLDFTPATSIWYDAPLGPNQHWTDNYTGLDLSVGGNGLDVTATFGTPSCHRPPTMTLSTGGATVSNNGSICLSVTAMNNDLSSCAGATYDLSSNAPLGWGSTFVQSCATPGTVISQITLAPGASTTFGLIKTVPRSTESGSYAVPATATRTTISGTGSVPVTVVSGCTLGDPLVEMTPDPHSVAVNEPAEFSVKVTSRDTGGPSGCGPHLYQLTTSEPAGWPVPVPISFSLDGGGQVTTKLLKRTIPGTAVVGNTYTVNAIVTSAPSPPPASPHVGTDTASLTVLGPCTKANPTVWITPPARAVSPLEEADFTFHIRNNNSPTCQPTTFTTERFVPEGWEMVPEDLPCHPIPCPTTVTLRPGEEGEGDPIGTVPPAGTPPGVYSVTGVAQSPGFFGNGSASVAVNPACARTNPTVVITPPSSTVDAGVTDQLTVTVTNNDAGSTCAAVTYTLTSMQPSGWTGWSSPMQVTLAPGASAPVTLPVRPPITEAAGAYAVSVTATEGSHTGTGSATVNVNAVCARANPTVTVTPASTTVDAGRTALLSVSVRNNDIGAACVTQPFALAALQPAGWTGFVATPLSVAPGATQSTPFYETPPVQTNAVHLPVGVSATSGSYTATGTALVTVRPVCIRGTGPVVTLSPEQLTVTAGASAHFTVTMTDNDQGAACAGYVVDLETGQSQGLTSSVSPASAFVPAHGTATADLTVTSQMTDPGGNYFVLVSALRGNTIGDDSTGSAMLTVQPLCIRRTPTVTLSPPTMTVEASQTAAYTITVTNQDSAACGSSIFTVSGSVPASWGLSFMNYNLSIAPGGSGTSVMNATPPISTAPGAYTVNASFSSPASGSGSATAQCQVTAPTLKVSLSLPGTTFARNTTVPITATTRYGAPLQSGVKVTYHLTLPNGTVKTQNSTTGSNGTAVWNYKVTTAGAYSIVATATWNGKTATSNTIGFTVN